DPRFLTELAGVSYKQNNFSAAKRELRGALRLNSQDAYTLEFLGTIYFVEGNLEAALKYWNRIDKPRLRNVTVEPAPPLQAALLSGTPYATIYPEYYNFRGSAANLTSLLRWDSEKRRAAAFFSTPPANDPSLRLQLYLDARNENWNLTNTFFGAGFPLSDLNL